MTPLLTALKNKILLLEQERAGCDSKDLADRIYALQLLALELAYWTTRRTK